MIKDNSCIYYTLKTFNVIYDNIIFNIIFFESNEENNIDMKNEYKTIYYIVLLRVTRAL